MRGKRARVFLLSPATCSGPRASLITSLRSRFALAEALRSPAGAPLGEVFSFLSGLYFRGKLAYARAFADPPESAVGDGTLVITPHAGLRSPEMAIDVAALRAAATVEIRVDSPRYRRPLESSAVALARAIGSACDVILLGSISSPKYVDVLSGIFGESLAFPREFLGRGDMSRGALMLRSVAEGRELEYVPIARAPASIAVPGRSSVNGVGRPKRTRRGR